VGMDSRASSAQLGAQHWLNDLSGQLLEIWTRDGADFPSQEEFEGRCIELYGADGFPAAVQIVDAE
jgi:L-rhamnose isomerase